MGSGRMTVTALRSQLATQPATGKVGSMHIRSTCKDASINRFEGLRADSRRFSNVVGRQVGEFIVIPF
jgi:hypothetical protein